MALNRELKPIFTVSVQCVHPRELLAASLACEGPVVGVELLVALAVVLAREALATARPMALERLFLVVRADVA